MSTFEKGLRGSSAATYRHRAQLYSRLTNRFALARQPIVLSRSAIRLGIYRPAAFNPLLRAAAADPEDQLPYWALVWPSGIALADHLLNSAQSVAGHRVLELGCGLGITASAAMLAGADLSVTDYAATALLLCRLNALE